jgi:hypothetical protein
MRYLPAIVKSQMSNYPLIVPDESQRLRREEVLLRMRMIHLIAAEESRSLTTHEISTVKRYCDELDGTPTKSLWNIGA